MANTRVLDGMTPSEAGLVLKRSPARIRQMVDRGELPAIWTALGRLIDRAAVEALAASRRQAAKTADEA